VVDTSPLINPHLNLASELALFFDRVFDRKGRFRYRLNKLYRTGFFTRCKAAGAFNVELLQAQLGDERSARAVAGLMGKKAVHAAPAGPPQPGRASPGTD
jgi:hypothetical protein